MRKVLFWLGAAACFPFLVVAGALLMLVLALLPEQPPLTPAEWKLWT